LFSNAGGIPASCVARWDGSCWHTLGDGITGAPPFMQFAPAVNTLAVHGGSLYAGGVFTQAGQVNMANVGKWSDPRPTIAFTQPGGAGTGVVITNTGLVSGHEYRNVASFDVCPGCPGSGPYGGLCINDFTFVDYELAFPIGAVPFHFIASGATAVMGPFAPPVGVSFDAVCADVTGGTIACLGLTVRVTLE